MARTVNATGTGLQLWKISRLYVELYSTWPSAAPSEVWTSEVISYRLPRSRLGGCLEGELQVVTMPSRLPAGFASSALPGQPVRCTFGGMDRLVRVIAVLPSGDEIIIYTGALGVPKASGPRQWQIPLIAPDSLRMQEFVSGSGVPTPAGIAPLSATSRIYGSWSAASSTPLTTFETWWKSALQNDPMAEYCVGPDLVFAAGSPTYTTPTVYTVDSRAYSLQSAGRNVTPYLTKIRRWAQGVGSYNPAAVDSNRTAAIPLFAPTRTAAVSGSVSSSVTTLSAALSGGGGGDISAPLGGEGGVTLIFSVPDVTPGRVQDTSVIANISIGSVTGDVKVYLHAQGIARVGGFVELYENQYLAVPGNFKIQVKLNAADVGLMSSIYFITNLKALNSSSSASGSSAPGGGSIRYDVDSYSVSYGQNPVGLDVPPVTAEAWNFSLPGIHAGPLLATGLPGGVNQYASTVINASQAGIWTDVQCGPLPYSSSPVDANGRWTG
ncbi:hypothetical protein GCM10022631_29510 [Deinococcus rubellus]|uniref:Minor tail protein n=1 Tax=Deinococcus rubellus TaxID=1889240 RepID=A0ABY5YGL5_9DEIO|nr:hypothetical protein [Deinococcus rubellus]UWX64202.1 hypothetical protein N0D28_00540 [Deinococcus rubellus]